MQIFTNVSDQLLLLRNKQIKQSPIALNSSEICKNLNCISTRDSTITVSGAVNCRCISRLRRQRNCSFTSTIWIYMLRNGGFSILAVWNVTCWQWLSMCGSCSGRRWRGSMRRKLVHRHYKAQWYWHSFRNHHVIVGRFQLQLVRQFGEFLRLADLVLVDNCVQMFREHVLRFRLVVQLRLCFDELPLGSVVTLPASMNVYTVSQKDPLKYRRRWHSWVVWVLRGLYWICNQTTSTADGFAQYTPPMQRFNCALNSQLAHNDCRWLW